MELEKFVESSDFDESEINTKDSDKSVLKKKSASIPVPIKKTKEIPSWAQNMEDLIEEKYDDLINSKETDLMKIEIETRFGKLDKDEIFNPNIEKTTFDSLYQWISSEKNFVSLGKDRVTDLNFKKGYRLRRVNKQQQKDLKFQEPQPIFKSELKISCIEKCWKMHNHNYDIKYSVDEEMDGVDFNFKFVEFNRFKNRQTFLHFPFLIEFSKVKSFRLDKQNNSNPESHITHEVEIEWLSFKTYKEVLSILESLNIDVSNFIPLENFSSDLRKNKDLYKKNYTRMVGLFMNKIIKLEPQILSDNDKKNKAKNDMFSNFNQKRLFDQKPTIRHISEIKTLDYDLKPKYPQLTKKSNGILSPENMQANKKRDLKVELNDDNESKSQKVNNSKNQTKKRHSNDKEEKSPLNSKKKSPRNSKKSTNESIFDIPETKTINLSKLNDKKKTQIFANDIKSKMELDEELRTENIDMDNLENMNPF